jgi:hypothetical protein
MAKKQPRFTEDELKDIGRAAGSVWQEIGCDILQALGEGDESKTDESKTVSRLVVIELVIDCSRLEQMLKRKPWSKDAVFMARVDDDLYRQKRSQIEQHLKDHVFKAGTRYGF